ncbi:acyltransferase family protein [Microbacterium sp. NPDC089987]|uniref:acyltransferase family protein n=1 Tax=Microbacterium sp. NPDC089987 TaxID=3364202 RepID=UPI00380079D2
MKLMHLRERLSAPDTTTKSEYRTDIDGLRALAILLVVIYHVWLGRVSGGVDVFLMVSAYFLTASFVRRVQGEQPLALGSFWLRRFRRLLPAAAVTIVGVLAVAFVSYPRTEWPRIWAEGWSSLFYVENWQLAFSEVDYYARDAVRPSPFQHFWSLSVQGQVFILWPLIIAAVWLLLRGRRHAIVPALAIVFGAIFVSSLTFSIVETWRAQSFAYFDSRARLWEFAAGSLVALALPFVRSPRWSAAILGWSGVIGIVLCGIVLDVESGFPGYLALWPVVCTALVIVAGRDRAPYGPSPLLESAPLRYVSRDAYALYLVHWPVLVTWMVVTGRSEPGWLAGLCIVAVSFVLARLVSALVERPIRDAAALDRLPRLGAVVLVAAVAVPAVPLASWQFVIKQKEAALMATDSGGYPGAAQVDNPIDLDGIDLPLIPFPTKLDDEWVDIGASCSGSLEPTESVLKDSCVQTHAALNPQAFRVLVMGDSHAQQLMSPLTTLAEEQEWGLLALLKGGCSIGVGAPTRSVAGPECEEWRAAAVDYAMRIQPDAVYLVVTRATPSSPEVLVEGIENVVDALTAEGIEVIAVRDNPRFDFDMYECAITESEAPPGARVKPCSVADIGLAAPDQLDALAARRGVTLVDFRPWLCPDGFCRGSIGNIGVYIDDNHLSNAYGRTLTPILRKLLQPEERTGGDTG